MACYMGVFVPIVMDDCFNGLLYGCVWPHRDGWLFQWLAIWVCLAPSWWVTVSMACYMGVFVPIVMGDCFNGLLYGCVGFVSFFWLWLSSSISLYVGWSKDLEWWHSVFTEWTSLGSIHHSGVSPPSSSSSYFLPSPSPFPLLFPLFVDWEKRGGGGGGGGGSERKKKSHERIELETFVLSAWCMCLMNSDLIYFVGRSYCEFLVWWWCVHFV